MRTRNIILIVVGIAACVVAGWWLFRSPAPAEHAGHEPAAAAGGEAAPAGEPRVLYYYDPMRPEVHFDAPGKSPFMDMELVPKYADETGGDGEGVVIEIDPRMAQNLGVRTAPVTRGTFSHSFDAVGAVEVDEHLIYAVEGTLQADGIHGDKVITRCASKYQPMDKTATRDQTPPR